MTQSFDYSRFGKTWALVANDDYNDAAELMAAALNVPVASVTYLLHNGWKQSLQDSAAQPVAAANTAGDDVPAAGIGAMDKRVDAIMNGTVKTRGGAARVTDRLAQLVRDITAAELIKWAKGKTKKLPKGKDLAAMKIKFYDKNKATIDAAAQAALAAESAIVVEFDI